MVRRGVLATFLAAGIFAGSVTAAQAAPVKPDFPLITVGCPDGEGGYDMLQVKPRGAVAFVFDEAGVATGEKLFIRSIDAALFSDAGQLLWEYNKAYGKRTGHGEPVSCSGSFRKGSDGTVFFDVLVTRR
ncbi:MULTISPECIES: hypothetical protein [unclassified Nesterenkonia]|uniref:hypothetical protein n=1 Tax=unclassified Nesterenkonia TaxID=2629769 RepID=UPI001F4CABFB|nr:MULTISPECIES: hypothetical protein [unclassified Nesterenkonia]MCH8560083.1 hypothetical protein [Nesterenkonia sp. DZ6]MCH8562264.1 hypothetical protein [Nesterenkonia sp. YGD6]MCH8569833.1 hypothetical protein [Nesterenkonia sp. AY15]